MLFQVSIFLQDIRQGNKPAYIGMLIFMTTGVAQLILAAECTTGIFLSRLELIRFLATKEADRSPRYWITVLNMWISNSTLSVSLR